jgi:hypothetical protein
MRRYCAAIVLIARCRSFYDNNRSCGAALSLKVYHTLKLAAPQHGFVPEITQPAQWVV